MTDLAIYGAGGFGRETALLIEQINSMKSTWHILGFCDDQKEKRARVDDYQVIGAIKELNHLDKKTAVVLAIADPTVRKKVRESIKNKHIFFPTLIHPSVITGDSKRNFIGEGSIICAGCILTTNIKIGSFCIINLMTSVGHDVMLGDYCSIMPGCSISGFDTFSDQVYIGSGARILPQVSIGEQGRVGAGAVVTANVPAQTTVVGIPARALSKTMINNERS